MRFRAHIEGAGKTAAGMQIPAAVVEGLGSSKRPLVKVTINRHTYRSAIAVMGGVFMLGVSAENRAAAGVAAGQDVDVDIELDTELREVPVPADFAKALTGDVEARRIFLMASPTATSCGLFARSTSRTRRSARVASTAPSASCARVAASREPPPEAEADILASQLAAAARPRDGRRLGTRRRRAGSGC